VKRSSKHACLVLFSSFCAIGAALNGGVHSHQVLAQSSSLLSKAIDSYHRVNLPNNNASSFDDKPSSTFQLVVVSVDWISKGISNKPFRTLRLDRIKSKTPFTFQLIVGSKQVHQKKLQRIKANANLQTTRREAAPQFNAGCFYELIVDSKYPNRSHQLIVRYKYSTISLHFCKDCRIFREGVKDEKGVFVKEQSANIPDAIKKWRRSSNSNNDATCVIFNEDVSHRVDVASEHGDDYDDNNPLQRLIIPLLSTPEAEMQMAVNVFELAGAFIFCIIIRTKPQQLIGEQFIASNNSVVGFQLVVESILILHAVSPLINLEMQHDGRSARIG